MTGTPKVGSATPNTEVYKFPEATTAKTEEYNWPSPGKKLTPEQKAANEQKAINMYKKQGYEIIKQDDGSYIMTDPLKHKSKVHSFGLTPEGTPTAQVLDIQIIDPSQQKRFEAKMQGKKETAEERAKYAQQAINIVKNAGYKVQDEGNGTYILTAPDGTKSKVKDFDISPDGGASWTTLPVHIGESKPFNVKS